MTSYKKTLFALSLMTLSLAPFNGVLACFGWCGSGADSEDEDDRRSERQPIVRAGSASSLVVAPPLLAASSASVLSQSHHQALEQDDSRQSSATDTTLSRMVSGDLTSINMSRASVASVALPRDNDDLIPHLVRMLTEGSYTGISFAHTSQKLVIDFNCQDAGTMTIALVCVAPDSSNSVDTECAKGTAVNKRQFPLVSSLIVSAARDAIHTHHKIFSRILNGALQATFDRTETAHYRLSADQKLREFVLDLRGQSGTSFITLYGVSAPKGHPSLDKRVKAYK